MVKGVFYRLILEARAEFLGVSAREILEIILDLNHVAVHIAGGLEKAVDAHGARGIVDVGENDGHLSGLSYIKEASVPVRVRATRAFGSDADGQALVRVECFHYRGCDVGAMVLRDRYSANRA